MDGILGINRRQFYSQNYGMGPEKLLVGKVLVNLLAEAGNFTSTRVDGSQIAFQRAIEVGSQKDPL
jgi:hypothetical protein